MAVWGGGGGCGGAPAPLLAVCLPRMPSRFVFPAFSHDSFLATKGQVVGVPQPTHKPSPCPSTHTPRLHGPWTLLRVLYVSLGPTASSGQASVSMCVWQPSAKFPNAGVHTGRPHPTSTNTCAALQRCHSSNHQHTRPLPVSSVALAGRRTRHRQRQPPTTSRTLTCL